MATVSELAQFRRLIGDYETNSVNDLTLKSFLDDAVRELTADFAVPVTNFDVIVGQYKPEIIYKAAINWWWNRAAKLVEHHSQMVGSASQSASEKWDRAMEMITRLEARYETIQALGTDITFGNISYFSKATLTRVGGQSEEEALTDAE